MRMTKMSITTRIGDEGTTRLFTGETVSKASLRPDAYGVLDELVSILGLAKSLVQEARLPALLEELQQSLFRAGAELASEGTPFSAPIGPEDVSQLDALCAEAEEIIEMPTGFILPGGTQAGATLDIARTIARRLERNVVFLQEQGVLANADLLIWLNRLSDLLWLFARWEEGDAMKLKS